MSIGALVSPEEMEILLRWFGRRFDQAASDEEWASLELDLSEFWMYWPEHRERIQQFQRDRELDEDTVEKWVKAAREMGRVFDE